MPPVTVTEILEAHRSGTRTPEDTIKRCFELIRAHDDPAMFITLRSEEDVLADARKLMAGGDSSLPLFGVPVAVKDNIDVANLPTTAACPAFAYTPTEDATAVAKLRAAGALIIGKTNLDQFATGLVGVRSPYGIPRNAIRADLVPGGSSSGSAVAVSSGIVPLALGTDTAGSGRVPAMLNNIVGLKPSLGLISTSGVLPACRTLDCVSIFALTVEDAKLALDVVAGFDASDPYSLPRTPGDLTEMPATLRVGVPMPGQLKFFGDSKAEDEYEKAIERLKGLGADIIPFDITPLYETAQLLYDGPWVNERLLVIRDLLDSNPEAVHPVTRKITEAGKDISSADTFAALYKVQAMRRVAEKLYTEVDVLALPTAPSAYTVEQLLANPIELNSRLGTYTNFVNLLDMSGLAIPASMRSDGIPFGITLLGPAEADGKLASIGRMFQRGNDLALGATGANLPAPMPVKAPAPDMIDVAVVGAHLSGMPLNWQLTDRGATLKSETKTSADYRLYALNGTVPAKPGLLRSSGGKGAAIAIEIWTMPLKEFGSFVSEIPAPLSIGTLTLEDGSTAKGFLVEANAIAHAEDITALGGWRAYINRAN